METSRFDSLVRALGEGGTTRRTLTSLIGGAVLATLPFAGEAKKKKKCKKKPIATICAGKCGPVKNKQTCKKTVDCGSCPCIPITQCPPGKDCGTVPDGCGGVVHCQFLCINPTPICTDNVCAACERNDQCASGEICDNGSCETCDVCATGCTYSTPQAAINDAAGPSTIRICPGTYGGIIKDNNARDVTIIGAGDGEDAATNTILTDSGTSNVVSFIFGTSTLRGVRITGGGGTGLSNNLATLTLTNCTITENHASSYPGGIQNGGTLNATNIKVISNTAGELGGGILNDGQITFAGTNLVAFNKLTNPGASTGSGIYNNPDGTFVGFANVEVRDNEPAEFQCFGCPS